jgi:hypothetical protein
MKNRPPSVFLTGRAVFFARQRSLALPRDSRYERPDIQRARR